MSDSLFVQCPCEHCHEIIDAARDEVGITIKCPVCSQPTVIHDPAHWRKQPGLAERLCAEAQGWQNIFSFWVQR